MKPARQALDARGFTLIEMVVVLAIMGILAMAAQPLLELTLRRAQEAALRHALRELRGAIDAHRREVQQRRISAGADGSPYPRTLQSLVDGVARLADTSQPRADTPNAPATPDTRHYLLRRLPRDPFADPALPAHQSWGLRASTSPPDAPQAGADVFDVYSRSELRALDGTRYSDW